MSPGNSIFTSYYYQLLIFYFVVEMSTTSLPNLVIKKSSKGMFEKLFFSMSFLDLTFLKTKHSILFVLKSSHTSFRYLVTPYNRPKFHKYATWSNDPITFAINSTVGLQPYGIFINKNNTIYVADRENGRIQIWLDGHVTPTKTLAGYLSMPYSIFVTTDGNIYVDNGNLTGQIDKWSLSTNMSTVAMNSREKCFGLFIDINDMLYCSMRDRHQVVAKPLNIVSDILTVVAGMGCIGNTSNKLNSPHGIFVNNNFDLYVADCGNNRIQLFRPNQLHGITVAGEGATDTIALDCPTAIVLDADHNLFIVDSNNNRIVGSGPNGFQCLVGCSDSSCLPSNRLNHPISISFDNHGNMFITDRDNHRIQKFLLSSNSAGRNENILNKRFDK